MSGAPGALGVLRGLLAHVVRDEADAVDEVAGAEPGPDAAAGLVPGLQGRVPLRRAEELIDLGQRAGQVVQQPGQVRASGHERARGHGRAPGSVPNPAHAAVPGWAEYASSGTVISPPAGEPAR